jgi:hypothetical protein
MEFVPCYVCSVELGVYVVHTPPECLAGEAAFSTTNKEYEEAVRVFHGDEVSTRYDG